MDRRAVIVGGVAAFAAPFAADAEQPKPPRIGFLLFCYFVGGIGMSREPRERRQKPRVIFDWDPRRPWGRSA